MTNGSNKSLRSLWEGKRGKESDGAVLRGREGGRDKDSRVMSPVYLSRKAKKMGRAGRREWQDGHLIDDGFISWKLNRIRRRGVS